MKIINFCLVFFFIVFLFNALEVFCEPGSKVKGKKKKAKKKSMLAKDVSTGTDEGVTTDKLSLDLQKLSDAEHVLKTVLEEEELRAAEKKKKKSKKIAAIVLSTIATGLLLALLGYGSYQGIQKLNKGVELKGNEGKTDPQKTEDADGQSKEGSGEGQNFPEWKR